MQQGAGKMQQEAMLSSMVAKQGADASVVAKQGSDASVVVKQQGVDSSAAPAVVVKQGADSIPPWQVDANGSIG